MTTDEILQKARIEIRQGHPEKAQQIAAVAFAVDFHRLVDAIAKSAATNAPDPEQP